MLLTVSALPVTGRAASLHPGCDGQAKSTLSKLREPLRRFVAFSAVARAAGARHRPPRNWDLGEPTRLPSLVKYTAAQWVIVSIWPERRVPDTVQSLLFQNASLSRFC